MDVLGPVLGLVIAIGVVFATFKSVSHAHRYLASVFRNGLYIWLARIAVVIVGTIVGFVLASISWRWNEQTIIVGIPLPVAVWQLTDGRWLDFVSPVSVIIWLLNFIFWIGFVHLPVAILLWRKRKSNKK